MTDGFEMLLWQILIHTPIWVFGLFFVLLALGLFLSKERTVPMSKAFYFSCGMFAWTLISMLLSSKGNPGAILSWSLGLTLMRLFNFRLNLPRDVAYLADTRQFHFAGGHSLLILIMVIFFVRYAVGAATGMHPELRDQPAFMMTASFIFGLLSGVFFVRAMAMLRAVRIANKPIA